jgi:hypothetical protein
VHHLDDAEVEAILFDEKNMTPVGTVAFKFVAVGLNPFGLGSNLRSASTSTYAAARGSREIRARSWEAPRARRCGASTPFRLL